jgi:hypothetical protein
MALHATESRIAGMILVRKRTAASRRRAAFGGAPNFPGAISEGSAPERLTAAVVTGDYFGVLGMRAQRGRLLARSDDGTRGASAVTVLSDGFWRRAFGADPGAIGRPIRVNLSIAGIYGVVSSSVEARRREFGIRLALGAGRRRLLGDVLGRCARVAATGLAIGVPAALLASRSLSTILFQVSPGDPASVAAAVAVLAAAAILSGALPARRAANTDPTESLRAE